MAPEKMNLLGQVMNSREYLSIDADGPVEPNANQTTIELDVSSLSLNKINYL